MHRWMTAILLIGVFIVGACGDDSATIPELAESDDRGLADPGEAADTLEDAVAAARTGSATLTVGDETWTFDSVLCAIGEEETGDAGAEFVLSSIEEGLQVYVSIDEFGHRITLDDINDFESPRVAWSTIATDDFITIDEQAVTAAADFYDSTSDDLNTTSPGTFTGTCP